MKTVYRFGDKEIHAVKFTALQQWLDEQKTGWVPDLGALSPFIHASLTDHACEQIVMTLQRLWQEAKSRGLVRGGGGDPIFCVYEYHPGGICVGVVEPKVNPGYAVSKEDWAAHYYSNHEDPSVRDLWEEFMALKGRVP